MHNDYDPYGGHTKEEADAAFEDLFRELHGDGYSKDGFDTEEDGPIEKTSVYVLGPANATIDSICATICYANLKNKVVPSGNFIPCATSTVPQNVTNVIDYFFDKAKPYDATIASADGCDLSGDDNSSSGVSDGKDIIAQEKSYLTILTEDNYSKENEIILVAHNNPTDHIDNTAGINVDVLNMNNITEIIDTHGLEGLNTVQTPTVRIQPLGATCTIIAHMYREFDVPTEPFYASLLCAGIVTETNTFSAEKTTPADKLEAVTLAATAGLDISKIGEQFA